MFKKLKNWARKVKNNVMVLNLALKHPKTPLYAKFFVGIIVAYILNPIDLIPDFIPVLGYLDDVIILPVGILIAINLIPGDILAECREKIKNNLSND